MQLTGTIRWIWSGGWNNTTHEVRSKLITLLEYPDKFWLAQYLNIAKELAGITTTTANQEAKFRAAISRAYYAAFIQARNHLRDREGSSIPRTSDAHKYVSDQFDLSSEPLRQLVAEMVRLRIYRRTSRLCRYFSWVIWDYTNSFKIVRGSNFNFEHLVK